MASRNIAREAKRGEEKWKRKSETKGEMKRCGMEKEKGKARHGDGRKRKNDAKIENKM